MKKQTVRAYKTSFRVVFGDMKLAVGWINSDEGVDLSKEVTEITIDHSEQMRALLAGDITELNDDQPQAFHLKAGEEFLGYFNIKQPSTPETLQKLWPQLTFIRQV